MTDTPINIIKEFTVDVKEQYGNIYWVKLKDLMRKAEAYDYIISLNDSVYEPVNEQEEEKPEEIKLMGGRRKWVVNMKKL